MKLLLAAPHLDEQRGNAVTVRRIASSLSELGLGTEIIDTTRAIPFRMPYADVIHAFHARRFQEFCDKNNFKPGPFIITMTGTDLNHDLFDQVGRKLVMKCLSKAQAIHVFNKEAANILLNVDASLSEKIFIIHQGIDNFPIISNNKKPRTFTFFLPAAIRKVKNIPSAILMLEQLRKRQHKFRLLLAGPILEKAEGETVLDLTDKYTDWIDYAGVVPHQEMGKLYNQADVVLNSSITEGQPAAILEAMQARLPVLVSGNNGNRSIVTHNENGLIYETEEQFIAYAEQLLLDASLCGRLGEAAYVHVASLHSREYEANALLDLYKKILQA